MAAIETNLEELLGVIARQTIVINRQDKGLTELSAMYNEKVAECEKLQKEIEDLKLIDKPVLG
jgi:uncharacterized coiled-coil protein SlyX